MICKNCGQEVMDEARFCPYCGANLDESYAKKVTFKDGVMALYNKIFVFEGKTSRSEFNYGLLFLMIVSSVLSMLSLSSDLGSLGTSQMNSNLNDLLTLSTSKNIFDSYNLYNVGVSIMYAIFLSAPVFRRLTDVGLNHKNVKIYTILFIVSQLLCSSLLWCILPNNIYKSISFILGLLSIINLGILLICIFRSSAK